MKLLFSLLIVVLSLASQAQDIIKFKNGSTQEVKVVGVDGKNISYRIDTKNSDAAIYSISISKIESVQYANGTIEDFSIFKEETANLQKASLIEFNMIDLAFQRIGINYELFPSKKRNWSFTIPIRFTINPYSYQHLWTYTPWIETGLAANLYLIRKNKSNLSVGLEANYTYSKNTISIWNETTGLYTPEKQDVIQLQTTNTILNPGLG